MTLVACATALVLIIVGFFAMLHFAGGASKR